MNSKPDPDTPVTYQMLEQAVDAILQGIGGMIGNVCGEFKELKSEVVENRRQINNLKTDTPTQKEFTALKQKVDRYHPAN